jgi:hypothetical protein
MLEGVAVVARGLSVMLLPVVTIAHGSYEKRALDLHETAHDLCFIAASVSIPILHEPQIKVARDAQVTPGAKPILRSTETEPRA